VRLISFSFLCFSIIAPMATAQEEVRWASVSGKIINKKTKKPVPDAIVFLKSLGDPFPIHADDKQRMNLNIQLPPGNRFATRIVAHYPYYVDSKKTKVPTGQKLFLIGDPHQDHVIRLEAVGDLATDDKAMKDLLDIGDPKALTKSVKNLPAGNEIKLELSCLTGHQIQSQTYRDLRMSLFVFNHPYYAITQKDGSFTIPRVPANMEAIIWAWQEDVGYLLTKAGKKTTFKEGKNTFNIESNPTNR
jgi:hypothetical protein